MRMKSCGNPKLCPAYGRKNVQASTTDKIKKLFNALTMKEKDITIEDLAKRIVISGITTYGLDEIIENIKQASIKTINSQFTLPAKGSSSP